MPEAPISVRVILDYDGTLTYEDEQAELLRRRSLETLADEILHAPPARLEEAYWQTQRRLLAEPHRHGWIVRGQMAAYCDEGAFLLNTATMQEMLSDEPAYRQTLAERFADAAYEPVMACVNWLFHALTADMPAFFRPDADITLRRLLDAPAIEAVVLTNSRGDKVRRALTQRGLPLLPEGEGRNAGDCIRILGDVRQYDMAPAALPGLPAALWADARHPIDLRRPVYQQALQRERADVRRLCVVADGLSLAGSLPLALGLPFFLVKASYTPAWVIECVAAHPSGVVLDELGQLTEYLDRLMEAS